MRGARHGRWVGDGGSMPTARRRGRTHRVIRPHLKVGTHPKKHQRVRTRNCQNDLLLKCSSCASEPDLRADRWLRTFCVVLSTTAAHSLWSASVSAVGGPLSVSDPERHLPPRSVRWPLQLGGLMGSDPLVFLPYA